MHKRKNIKNTFFNISALFLGFIFWVGCSSTGSVTRVEEKISRVPVSSGYYDLPSDFRDPVQKQKTIEYYTDFLRGRKIFLDPGHGGKDRSNRSSNGAIIEADINLRVAQHLRNYLELAEADVIMSRADDSTVELQQRTEMFNNSGAEIYVSIHHNAGSKQEDYWTNYTSTFYHAHPEDFEYEPSSHDLAKYVQRDLAYAVGNSGGLGSFDGTYSDYRPFLDKGFFVLREIKRPGILIECTFHTNRFEEKRLVDDQYNSLEAWGIFRGLGRYFANSVPGIEIITEESKFDGDDLKLIFKLVDEEGIDFSATKVFFDKSNVNFTTSENDSKIMIHVKDITPGEHEIRVVCMNKNEIHSWPHNLKIKIR